MWQWGRMEYHPHCTLLFGDIDRCDMILIRRILQGGSMDGIDRACWWVHMGKHHAFKQKDIGRSCGIGRRGSTIEIKDAS